MCEKTPDHISFQFKCGKPDITDHNVSKTFQEEYIILLQVLLGLVPKKPFLIVLLNILTIVWTTPCLYLHLLLWLLISGIINGGRWAYTHLLSFYQSITNSNTANNVRKIGLLQFIGHVAIMLPMGTKWNKPTACILNVNFCS